MGLFARFLAAATLVVGALGAQTVHAQATGIKDTKHNLGSTSLAGNNQTSATAEICVFCHTPHASNTNVKAPLWNKPTNAGSYTTYTTATSSTIDGAVDMNGISLACLSCHDGTQAMDAVVNAPGSGLGSGRLGTDGQWTGTRQSNGLLTGVANLGQDLSNDHPVGIQYCGGGISTGSASATGVSTGTCADGDFNAPSNTAISTTRVWWVDTPNVGTANVREKTDMILYARAPASGNFQPYVECASCHDPHSTNTTFLRVQNTGSQVCLACHNK